MIKKIICLILLCLCINCSNNNTISQNNNSLNGSATNIGDNFIIPSDIKMEEITISITKKGKNKRNPI